MPARIDPHRLEERLIFEGSERLEVQQLVAVIHLPCAIGKDNQKPHAVERLNGLYFRDAHFLLQTGQLFELIGLPHF
jgi:hypothetical protein